MEGETAMTERDELIKKAAMFEREKYPYNVAYDVITTHKLMADFALSVQSKWISVKEQLPLAYQTGDWNGKKSDPFLGLSKVGFVYQCVLYSGIIDGSEYNDFFTVDDFVVDIEFWMPLPKPPRKEE